VSTDNPVRLVDAFLGILNAKKNRRCLQGTLQPAVEKGKNKKLAIIAVCDKLLAPVFAVIKSRMPYEDDYVKKLA